VKTTGVLFTGDQYVRGVHRDPPVSGSGPLLVLDSHASPERVVYLPDQRPARKLDSQGDVLKFINSMTSVLGIACLPVNEGYTGLDDFLN
jgi:hypothetical protein